MNRPDRLPIGLTTPLVAAGFFYLQTFKPGDATMAIR